MADKVWRRRRGQSGLKADKHKTDTRRTRLGGAAQADTWRTRFGGAAKADTRRTQGGHMADKLQEPEPIAASLFFLRENCTVNCWGKKTNDKQLLASRIHLCILASSRFCSAFQARVASPKLCRVTFLQHTLWRTFFQRRKLACPSKTRRLDAVLGKKERKQRHGL